VDEATPSTDQGTLTWVLDCARPGGVPRQFIVLEASSLEIAPKERANFESRLHIRTLDLRSGTIRTSYGSIICETIVELGQAEIKPIAITVSGPGGTFNTGTSPDIDCVHTGIAVLPASRAGDRSWAFLASTMAIGKEGQARLGTPFDVYLDEGQDSSRRVETAIFDPTELEWTPDGMALIVSGRTQGGTGLTWRLNPDTGALAEVLPFQINSLAFSADAKMATALRKTATSNLRTSEVITFPISGLID
jgi:hypothetical protein